MDFKTSIIFIDVPFFIGLEVLLDFNIALYFDQHVMESKTEKWKIPILYVNGHPYILQSNVPANGSFTRQEPLKMHQSFMNPSTRKLINLIKTAFPKKATSEVRQLLQDIATNCEQCSEFMVPPFRFRTSIPKTRLSSTSKSPWP